MASLPRPSSTFDVGRPSPLEGSTLPSSTMEAPKDSVATAMGVEEQFGWDSSSSNRLHDPGSGPYMSRCADGPDGAAAPAEEQQPGVVGGLGLGVGPRAGSANSSETVGGGTTQRRRRGAPRRLSTDLYGWIGVFSLVLDVRR